MHETYVVQGLVDGEVARAQAHRRADKNNESTIVHDHPYLSEDSDVYREQFEPCTSKCLIYQPGKEVISYLDYRNGAVAPNRKEEE